MLQEQVQEWTENPVTVALRDHIDSLIQELQAAKGDAYHPFQPERTQEILAGLNGAVDTWEIALEALAGDWAYFEEEENEEPIGD